MLEREEELSKKLEEAILTKIEIEKSLKEVNLMINTIKNEIDYNSL